jgi:hypothetical protein
MTARDATVAVRLGFLPASKAIPDPDHPGFLRAGPRTSGPYGGERVELHTCAASDACQDDTVRPDLLELGFDTVDLSGFDDLQQTLGRVAEAGHLTDDDASTIRTALDGATLALSSGATASVLHIADEGLIMRKSGPDGMSVVGPRSIGANGHGAATSVHADQDVYGTPMAQLMDGRAPTLFRHDSPDGQNHDARLMLVNLWIPLHQITQPLALADGRSIDRRRHQLRYGLATTSFLERDDDMAINDIWTFLHDPGQRWHVRSEMDHRSAYLFNTLSTPHGACTLPGEDVAKQCYGALEAAESAVAASDRSSLATAVSSVVGLVAPDDTPPALRSAIAEMVAVAEAAHDDPNAVCGDRADEWSAASRDARHRVVRMSLELRLVVNVESPRTDERASATTA